MILRYVRLSCHVLLPLILTTIFLYVSFKLYDLKCQEPYKRMNVPVLFDNWTNGFTSEHVPLAPPDYHVNNRRTHLAHPARTSKRWLSSFSQGYYADKFQYFISEPFLEGEECYYNEPIVLLYYNVHEACDLLSKFGTVSIISDSFGRHIWVALLHILTNNSRNGHLSKSALLDPNHILCNYDQAYSERACRSLVANTLDELAAPLCPNISLSSLSGKSESSLLSPSYSMSYFDLATHPTRREFYTVPNNGLPSVIIQGNGAHDLGNMALRFPADTQKTYKDAQLFMVDQVKTHPSALIYPLFTQPHNLITSDSAPYKSHWNPVAKRRVHTFAPLMADFFNQISNSSVYSTVTRPFPTSLDNSEDFYQLHLSPTDQLTHERVFPWSILELDRASTNLPFDMSFDGHHYSSFLNTIKAHAILNFMHAVLTELRKQ